MERSDVVPIEAISQRIFIIRGIKVMLDHDLAELYGVTTKRLNEQVRRNIRRFPIDFMFKLSLEEIKHLNRSQFATGSQRHRDLRFLPYAFTEHGVAMLSTVLKSARAIEMSVFIVRAFIKLREILASNKELAHKVEEIEREQITQNRHINAIYRILDKLIAQPARPNEPIGFNQ